MLQLIAFAVMVVLAVLVRRQQQRIAALELGLDKLRKAILDEREIRLDRSQEEAPAKPAAEALLADPPLAAVETAVPEPDKPLAAEAPLSSDDLASRERAPEPRQGQAPPVKRPDIETALGTHWAVWVGGIALALGGLFLVRYSIEAGIFGPGVRLTMATVFGLALAGAGEFIRRTGLRIPVEGLGNAYLPAILTAAGAFVLFGAVYAAHGIYGFIGPAAAFGLLGLLGIATIAAALLHGQALAGLGLLGSYATPLLVASEAPNHWALFGFLAIVLISSAAVARLRSWGPLMAGAFCGAGIWTLVYLLNAPTISFAILIFINGVTLCTLVFVWLHGRVPSAEDVLGIDLPSIAPAIFVGLSAVLLFAFPSVRDTGGPAVASMSIAMLTASAFYRAAALPTLIGAGVAAIVSYTYVALGGLVDLELFTGGLVIEQYVGSLSAGDAIRWGIVLGTIFALGGFWKGHRFAASDRLSAGTWMVFATAVPLVILIAIWFAFGNLDRDYPYALVALFLAVTYAGASEWIGRAEGPWLTGGPAVSIAIGGATAAALLAIHWGGGAGMTTVLAGLLVTLPAWTTRFRAYKALGWASVAIAVTAAGRIAFDPTIVGAERLGTTPVLNWLLAGYGVPAIACGYAAWQLARTTGGRPRMAMEAFAALFALVGLGMLVRHAMNGGMIDAGEPTLAEQSIYTLIALGGGAVLVALDLRSPSPVFRYGSLALGVLSAISIVLQHFLNLNPFRTDESTGRIAVFNLLMLGYLLPGAAMGALAWYARRARPHWYIAVLALIASLLGFAYATLSVRRLFHGEFIGLWKGFSQLETYSYSALWLGLGVALLTVGVRLNSHILRIASACLVVIAVAKVFLLDMSELEGVLRALSFIGLGAVLIGIGLFYQRMLASAAAK